MKLDIVDLRGAKVMKGVRFIPSPEGDGSSLPLYPNVINSIVQSAKSSARGFRTTKNLILIIYLRLGKLQFNLPT